jgi:signal transduction histidine kinase
MLSEECTGGYSPSGLKTRAGLLWFSTLKGLVVINPQLTGATQRGPSVVLEEVLVDGAPIASEPVHQSENSVLRIPPGRHRVEVRYTALGFAAPERIRFRHRMEGLESDWVEAGTRRAAFYSYVPPGKHRFQVLACSGDGVWNETGASLTLNVLPYFWQTSWFLAAVAIGLFASVVGSVRFIEKRKAHRQLRQLERERTLERERARIAQDLHDDLGASLSRISLLSDMAMAETRSHAPNGGHVDKISQLAGQTLRALDEIVWAVRPGSDSLQSLVEYIAHYAGELFKGNGVRCRLDLPDTLPARSLPPDMRHNIFLIAKEALTNSMKHAAAREVSVQIQATAGHLEILIRDDGHGFDLTASPGVRDGNGLMNMRQRAQAIGGTLDLQTQQGKGTSVRLCVALAGNGRLSDLKE